MKDQKWTNDDITRKVVYYVVKYSKGKEKIHVGPFLATSCDVEEAITYIHPENRDNFWFDTEVD